VKIPPAYYQYMNLLLIYY